MNLKSEQRQAQMREQAGMLVEMVQQFSNHIVTSIA
jgi:hypothetical protein